MFGKHKKLLVVSTESCRPEAAIDRALYLLKDGAGELTLLDVAESVADDLPAIAPQKLRDKLTAALIGQQEQRLVSLAERVREQGVSAVTKHVRGSPYRLAIQEVISGQYDLLIKVADTLSNDWRAPRGSTDNHILRKCPCPVWLESSERSGKHKSILAAVDPNPYDEEQHALSRAILTAAVELASQTGATLHVLHAWHVLGEFFMHRVRPLISDPETDRIVGEAFSRHAALLDDLCELVPADIKLKKHLLHQSAAPAIVELVQSEDVDLLLLGTVGRSGIPGLLIGNTAESVLGEVTCSVLAFKPSGFVSPVTLEA
jgi:nucleotide-binding universal stress UspA family protein